ncbi:MAG: type I glutamate--ammonia ligase [Thermoplasmatota archaeon]
MHRTAVAEAQETLREHDVQWVQGHFVDLLGVLRSVSLPVQRYLEDEIWEQGIGFDGSSVAGFSDVEQSDMVAIPDPATLQPMPWLYGGNRARVVMDVATVDTREPFSGDPRHIARRAQQQVQDAGYTGVELSPEFEFHVFPAPDAGREGEPARRRFDPREMKGYFAAVPFDDLEPFRNHLCDVLQATGIPVKYHHHEGGTWQHEIEIHPLQGPIAAGDTAIFIKFLARALGEMQNLHVTFMPKPVEGDAGSGMHVHLELMQNNTSAFYDDADEQHLSQDARYFIGGLLDHAAALTAITNPTVNSYKRLVPHYEAPIHVAWGSYNRSSLVRIPHHAGQQHAMDIEIRHPDASCNPYLAFAGLIYAGLDGIHRKIDPGPAVDANIYAMQPSELKQHGIARLPATLSEALETMQSDDVIREALGEHAFTTFLELKQQECDAYAEYVTPWEHDRYFSV